MSNCSALSATYQEIIQPLDLKAISRAGRGYFTVSGGALAQSGTPDMKVNMDAWVGSIGFTRTEVASGYVMADAQDVNYDRIDIVYINSSGALALHKGTASAQSPIGVSDWKRYEQPQPKESDLPEGVILGKVLIRSTANGGGSITTADIYMGTMFGQDHLNILDTMANLSTGWMPARETWTYAGADDPTFTFTASGDLTGKYQVGDRIKLTQTTAKYFILVAISYSSPNTTFTVYGGTDYDLANAAITDPYHSKLRSPQGFPFDPAKWSVVISDSGFYTQSSPDSATFYNLGSISISVPIGMWSLGFAAGTYNSNSSATIAYVQIALSTSTSSASDSNLMSMDRITFPTGSIQTFPFLNRSSVVSLAAKTTYYLIEKAPVTSGTTLGISGTIIPIKLEAVCAYL